MKMQAKPVQFVAIVGGSGSGKTWLARRLKRQLGSMTGILSQDDFYRDLSAMPLSERHRFNFDDPAAIDWELMSRCMEQIEFDSSVRLPIYDFSTHTRKPGTRRWKPHAIVLVEGLWLLHPAALRRFWSVSIFVKCPEELRLQRRIERDQKERGRSRASVLRQFREQVAPMHDRYVAPQAECADFVAHPPLSVERCLEIITKAGCS